MKEYISRIGEMIFGKEKHYSSKEDKDEESKQKTFSFAYVGDACHGRGRRIRSV